jgi:ABC-type transporter Mla subunit MlaD
MTDYQRHEIVSGLFVALATVAFALFAFKVGGADLFGLFREPRVRCRAHFQDVLSLAEGAAVKVGGRVVGEVTAIRMVVRDLAEGRQGQVQEIGFDISDRDLSARGATVSLRQDGPLSPHFLEFNPATWEKGARPPSIFEAAAAEPIEIAAVESQSVFDLIGGVVERAEPSLDELTELIRDLRRNFVNERNASRLDTALEDMRVTLANSRQLTARLAKLLDEELAPKVTGLVEDLARVSREVDERLDRVGTQLDAFLSTATGVLVDNRSELAESTRRLRRTLWQAELFARQILADPSTLLWGSDTPDFEAVPADESWLRLSGRAPPYEQRDEED